MESTLQSPAHPKGWRAPQPPHSNTWNIGLFITCPFLSSPDHLRLGIRHRKPRWFIQREVNRVQVANHGNTRTAATFADYVAYLIRLYDFIFEVDQNG